MDLIIITGPQGCGKTRKANVLKAHYKADHVIDGYEPGMRVPKSGRTLALTNLSEPLLSRCGGKVVRFKAAMTAIKRARSAAGKAL